jgi:oligosaccharyltransferase complex subunit alpha (ribophorin I)
MPGFHLWRNLAVGGSGLGNHRRTVMLTNHLSSSPVQYYKIEMPKPLAPNTPLTLQISLARVRSHRADPASIAQADKQYLSFKTHQYASVAYPTVKQKTKITAPNSDIPEYSQDGLEVSKSGPVLTYGPFADTKPGEKGQLLFVRHEFTEPVIHMSKLERDIEVSHWGGNLAIEDRYWMENAGAKLDGYFSRVKWVQTQYYKPPTAAIKMLTIPLLTGAKDVYFTDEIGNVSTSRYRSNLRESTLELRPRFPVFGGWNYSFTIGYNYELSNFLKKTTLPDQYVLKVPLFEGPSDSTVYEDVTVRVVLPEGATGVKFQSPVSVESHDIVLHKTFMDTIGRTTLVLRVKNVVDEQKRSYLYVSFSE